MAKKSSPAVFVYQVRPRRCTGKQSFLSCHRGTVGKISFVFPQEYVFRLVS